MDLWGDIQVLAKRRICRIIHSYDEKSTDGEYATLSGPSRIHTSPLLRSSAAGRCPFLLLLISNLRCQVEAEIAVVANLILDEERYLVAETQLDRVAQTACLAEVHEVLQREGQGNRLRKVDLDVLLRLVNIGVLPKSDGAISDVARAGELDAILCAFNRDCFRWSAFVLSSRFIHEMERGAETHQILTEQTDLCISVEIPRRAF
jgi:hypothetical protein